MTPTPILAHVEGEPGLQEQLHAQLDGHGITLTGVTEASEASDVADILLLADMTSERLEARLGRPYQAYIEARPDDHTLAGRIRAAGTLGRFCLSLTTPTAFSGVDTAHVVCLALRHRGGVPEPMHNVIELALQELIANAIVHGNLGLTKSSDTDVAAFETFCFCLRDRLSRPETARLWVTIAADWTPQYLDIMVLDEGQGYDPPERIEMSDDHATSGRGMAFVHQFASEVTVLAGGRCTTARFTLGTAPPTPCPVSPCSVSPCPVSP